VLLTHHVHHLDTTQDHTSRGRGLESEHRPHPPLYGPMILLNPIIQVAALPDLDWFSLAS
jgi:hypothetical protein